MTGVLNNGDRKLVSNLIKELGGFSRSGVSGKTDYLITGSILEDGRQV
jgi:NAD-dependent DNA ligase